MEESDLAVFFKVWFTLGVYGVVWLFRAFGFVNDYSEREVYRVGRLKWFVLGYVSAAAALVVSLLFINPVGQDGSFSALFVVTFYTFWGLVLVALALVGFCVHEIARHVRAIEQQRGIGKKVSPALALALYFAYLLAFPYLQSHMNVIHRASR